MGFLVNRKRHGRQYFSGIASAFRTFFPRFQAGVYTGVGNLRDNELRCIAERYILEIKFSCTLSPPSFLTIHRVSHHPDSLALL